MTYFGFLIRFLVIPLIIVFGLTLYDVRRGKRLPAALRSWPAWGAVALHVVVAVLYTTPWDNYLVATQVWWYNPDLVTGVVLGWVPIEEYTFFVLQTMLTGAWLLLLARRLRPDDRVPAVSAGLRWGSTAVVGSIWAISVAILAAGGEPGTYLGLILVWALPPIMLQLAFGADILWCHRRLVVTTVASVTVYLSAMDALAISDGTWTIAPQQSLQVFLGGVLPVEEFVFFLMTNTLIVFGVTLLLAVESRARVRSLAGRISLQTLKVSKTFRVSQE